MTADNSASSKPSEPDASAVAVNTQRSYGFPAFAWRALEKHPPPGIANAQRWRSPWLTSVFGAMLLVSLPIVIVTGLLSYIAYGPQFGQAMPTDVGWLKLPTFDWPTRPTWLYRLNQGLHIGLGLVIVPVILAKLWSVLPRLLVWPPARSIAQVLERISLLMLVGGILFELATGLLNIQYDYIFGFSFYTAHTFGAWVFIAGFMAHVAIKLPRMISSLRSRSFRAVMGTSREDTEPEPLDPDGLVARDPQPPTISRRGALALVGGGALLIATLTAGQTVGGFARHLALLIPRGRSNGTGPTDFPVNRTAAAAQIAPADTGNSWQLKLTGGPHTKQRSWAQASTPRTPPHTQATTTTEQQCCLRQWPPQSVGVSYWRRRWWSTAKGATAATDTESASRHPAAGPISTPECSTTAARSMTTHSAGNS